MKKVSKEEFFAAIGPRDVHPTITNDKYPYKADWKTRIGRQVVGRSEGFVKDGVAGTNYFLPD